MNKKYRVMYMKYEFPQYSPDMDKHLVKYLSTYNVLLLAKLKEKEDK